MTTTDDITADRQAELEQRSNPERSFSPYILRRLRLAKQWSQGRAAQAINLPPSWGRVLWSQWETGAAIPSAAKMRDIAFALGIEPLDLLATVGTPEPTPAQRKRVRVSDQSGALANHPYSINPEKIREYRKANSWTLANAGERAGFTANATQAWASSFETHPRRVRQGTLDRLLRGLMLPDVQTAVIAGLVAPAGTAGPAATPSETDDDLVKMAYDQGHSDGYMAGYAAGLATQALATAPKPPATAPVTPTPPDAMLAPAQENAPVLSGAVPQAGASGASRAGHDNSGEGYHCATCDQDIWPDGSGHLDECPARPR